MYFFLPGLQMLFLPSILVHILGFDPTQPYGGNEKTACKVFFEDSKIKLNTGKSFEVQHK